jgi:hypothetical protein
LLHCASAMRFASLRSILRVSLTRSNASLYCARKFGQRQRICDLVYKLKQSQAPGTWKSQSMGRKGGAGIHREQAMREDDCSTEANNAREDGGDCRL